MASSKATIFLQSWLINVLAVMVAANIVHGIHYDSFSGLLIAAFILGVLNMFLRPILLLFSLPFVLVTLGLFTLVVNALLLYLVGKIVGPFYVDGFGAAFWGALVISVVTFLAQAILGTRKVEVRTSHPPRPDPPPSKTGGSGPIIDV